MKHLTAMQEAGLAIKNLPVEIKKKISNLNLFIKNKTKDEAELSDGDKIKVDTDDSIITDDIMTFIKEKAEQEASSAAAKAAEDEATKKAEEEAAAAKAAEEAEKSQPKLGEIGCIELMSKNSDNLNTLPKVIAKKIKTVKRLMGRFNTNPTQNMLDSINVRDGEATALMEEYYADKDAFLEKHEGAPVSAKMPVVKKETSPKEVKLPESKQELLESEKKAAAKAAQEKAAQENTPGTPPVEQIKKLIAEDSNNTIHYNELVKILGKSVGYKVKIEGLTLHNIPYTDYYKQV